jgi:hypothetical protein
MMRPSAAMISLPSWAFLALMGLWADRSDAATCGGSLRCVADMRREPLEIYKWGRIIPKPDERDRYEREEDIDLSVQNKQCRRDTECSITEYLTYTQCEWEGGSHCTKAQQAVRRPTSLSLSRSLSPSLSFCLCECVPLNPVPACAPASQQAAARAALGRRLQEEAEAARPPPPVYSTRADARMAARGASGGGRPQMLVHSPPPSR